jgi:4-hydroxybenzoate polyprenyltransferase
MIRETLLFRNLVDNIPKNAGLYSVGILFLIISEYAFDVIEIVLGLIAFILSYSSVYVLNDVFDISEDQQDPSKRMRKPLALGSIEKSQAVKIWLILLSVGLLLSFLLNLMLFGTLCILLIINAFYSIPIAASRSLKYTILGLPLVFIMQFLKMLLPWTLTAELAQFPYLFASGFSLLYLVLFRGYKADRTIGESIIHMPQLFGAGVIVFLLSILIHQEPVLQLSIFLYLVAGIVLFRNSRLIDNKTILLGSVYIALGVIILYSLVLFL